MLFFYSTQTVSTSQTSELLHFLKNRVAKSISLLYTFGQFLAKSLKITHLNLLLITQKAFQSAYTPISIKVASEKNDAWSMFYSPRCTVVASLVSYVPATSLETQKANAANASMLCQQNVKKMYFKTLNPRLFNLRQWFEVRSFSVVILCKWCKFPTSLLSSCTWEFWMEFKKKSNSRRLLNNNK